MEAAISDDTARCIALYNAKRTEEEQVFNLFRATLRTGDPAAVTEFVTRHGYCLGGSAEEGICEKIVFEDARY